MFAVTTFEDVRDAILFWIIDVTGREVVLANAGEGPKPAEKYVAVYITVGSSPNFQTSTLSPDGLTETIRAITSMDVQIDFYGGDAMQDASRLIHSLKSQDRYSDLFTLFGLENVQDLRDLTFLETGTRKQRAQFVMGISCNLSSQFVSSYATSLPINLFVGDELVEEDIPGGENPRQKSGICPI